VDEDKLVEALGALGFGTYEAKAYRALLRLGVPAKGYEIARAAGLPTSKIYETLRRLTEKGAIVASDTEPVIYAPVPHRDLTARLRERSEAAVAAAEMELSALPDGGAPEMTWTVMGGENMRDLMRRVLDRAKQRVFAALWDAEMDHLAPALQNAHARGVELQVATYGTRRLGVPTAYDLSACGASAEERLSGRRLSLLVRDDVEAVAAEAYPGGAQAIWSSNRVFTLLCAEYAKSDIMGRCVIEALGEVAYQQLRQERPELRAMLRHEPLPARSDES
jgi:sugar-specific transcriptional regulator TrmB